MEVKMDSGNLMTLGDGSLNITSSGNVGIGLIAPTERLEVDGNVKGDTFIGNLESIDRHSDVDVTTTVPVSGQSLVYNGTNWVPGAPPGAIADGYNSGGGSYGGKYGLNFNFNSPFGDITWSSANSEWTLSVPGTYRFKATGYWVDPNSKQIQFRSSTTANTPAGSGTLVSSMNANTSYRNWQIVGEVTTTTTTYVWIENTSGIGVNYNWTIRLQRIA